MIAIEIFSPHVEYNQVVFSDEPEPGRELIWLDPREIRQGAIKEGTRWDFIEPNNSYWFERKASAFGMDVETGIEYWARTFSPEENTPEHVAWPLPKIGGDHRSKKKLNFIEKIMGKEDEQEFLPIFTNGRHRVEFMIYLGVESMPFWVTTSAVECLAADYV